MKKLISLLSVGLLFVGLNAVSMVKPGTADVNAETADLARDFAKTKELKYQAKAQYGKLKEQAKKTWTQLKDEAKALKEKAEAKYNEYKAQLESK